MESADDGVRNISMAQGQMPAAQNRTTWFEPETPLRRFLRTETSSALVLLVAAMGALIWANIDFGSYQSVWNSQFSIELRHWGVAMNLRSWINSGLMSFFFLTIGLEARREFDIGEFRDRPRIVLPV